MVGRFAASFLMGLTVTGCVWLLDHGGEDLENYAEAVFLRQNQATSEMMELADETEPVAGYEALLDAETVMRQACQPLNDYAERMQTDQSSNLLQQGEVAASLSACDQATRQLEHLLDQLD